MCGICGIKGLRSEERSACVKRMQDVLYHRGPDEEGAFTDGDLTLGVRRLKIIDLEKGYQPIYSEDRRIAIVCNGEIYNFSELRDSLIKKGHRFYTNSDVETLVHLYEEYGTDCLKFVKGMFSFALWDCNKKSLFVARDRFGIKPLYYYRKNGIFAFASELKALLGLPFMEKELNFQALNLYFSLEYVPSSCSIFKDVHKLKPAHYILYNGDGITITRYWSLGGVGIDRRITFNDAKEKLAALLSNSVKEHLVSDVPLGVFLSGGIDSSALVAMARKFYKGDLMTFSMGFEEKSFNESPYAFCMSKHIGTKHHNYVFTIGDFADSFNCVVDHLDEPFADLSIFPTYMLSKYACQEIKVALSGEGADELFMGYPTYLAHKYIDLFNMLPTSLKKFVTNFANSLPVSSRYFSVDYKLKQFVKGIEKKDPIVRHLMWMGAFSNDEQDLLFNEGLNENRFASGNSLNGFIEKCRKIDEKEKNKMIQHIDTLTYLSDDLLVKSDRAGMWSSLETRIPYLDHKLVEFIWSLDYKLIFQKRLLKAIMRGTIPHRVLSRPKKGFAIPFSSWLFDRRFFKIIEKFFDKDYIDKQGLFNYDYVNSLLREHLSKKKDNRKKLKTYLMFQAWFKNGR